MKITNLYYTNQYNTNKKTNCSFNALKDVYYYGYFSPNTNKDDAKTVKALKNSEEFHKFFEKHDVYACFSRNDINKNKPVNRTLKMFYREVPKQEKNFFKKFINFFKKNEYSEMKINCENTKLKNEEYSDLESLLSNITYENLIEKHQEILNRSNEK